MSWWCKDVGLMLNSQKTVILHFKNNRITESDPQSILVKLANKSICNKNETKFLGLNIDDHLTWSSHIDFLANKLASACYAINNLKQCTTTKTVLLFYNAFVQAKLSYGIIAWGASQNILRLLVLQKRIMRLIDNASITDHCKPIFKKYNIMSVCSLYYFKLLIFVRNNQHSLTTNAHINRGMQTRHQNDFSIPSHKTSHFESSPLYRGIKAYNKLPLYLKNMNNFVKFKTELKRTLTHNVLYNHNDYFSLVFNAPS